MECGCQGCISMIFEIHLYTLDEHTFYIAKQLIIKSVLDVCMANHQALTVIKITLDKYLQHIYNIHIKYIFKRGV